MRKTSISEDRAARETAIERILSQENHALIQEGIDAYKRDLPRLLEERKLRHKVAYRGSERVAIAPTYGRLHRQLKKKGFSDERELFIISVSPLEDEGTGLHDTLNLGLIMCLQT